MSGALAVICLVALGVPGGAYGWVALALSAGLVLALMLALWLTPAPQPADAKESAGAKPVELNSHWLARIVRSKHAVQMADGWRKLSADSALLTKLALWNLAGVLLHAVAFVFAFRIAGFAGGWLVPVTSSAFARIGSLIGITPAGLGIFEAFGAVSAQIAGADPERALTGVLLVRLFLVALTIVGAIPFLPLLLPQVRKEEP
jgi:hypothetical protein